MVGEAEDQPPEAELKPRFLARPFQDQTNDDLIREANDSEFAQFVKVNRYNRVASHEKDNWHRLTWPLKVGLLPDIQGRGKGQDDQRNSPVRRAVRPQEYIAIRLQSLTWRRRGIHYLVAHSALLSSQHFQQ